MDSQEKLRQQMVQIGARYLVRTLGELEKLKELAQLVAEGSNETTREVELMAHKIHGSGAMFGFDSVSDSAGEVEYIAAHLNGRGERTELNGVSDGELRQRLADGVARLEAQTRSAAQASGISLNAG